jgi:hypothetical protein
MASRNTKFFWYSATKQVFPGYPQNAGKRFSRIPMFFTLQQKQEQIGFKVGNK